MPAKPATLIKSSLVYAGLTLVSRLAGLARDLVITARLGASLGIAADAWNTALAVSNLGRRIFAEGTLTSAFVPAYAHALEADGERGADGLASDAIAAMAAFLIVFTAAAEIAMPLLMYLLNPGYAHDPAKFRLAVVLTQLILPYLPCMAIVALLSGALQARDRFMLSAAAPILMNLFVLAFVLPTRTAIGAAYAASAAAMVSGFAQVAWLWWGARRTGARIALRRPRLTPAVRAMIAKAAPGAFAASAVQINIFISGIIASQTAGARSWLAMADRFYQLPLGLVGVAIGVALLPRLSQALAGKDHNDAQVATDQAVVFALALALPAAAAMTAAPFYLVDGLYTRGRFTVFDARQTAVILFHYGWGTPAFVLNRILSPVFFARGDMRSPMRFAVLSLVLNLVLGVVLLRLIGVGGIAAATSIAAWINIGQMVWLLKKRGDYEPTAHTAAKLARIVAANLVLFGLVELCTLFRPQIQGLFAGVWFHGFGPKEASVIVLSALIIALYPLILLATGGITPTEARTVFRSGGRSPQPQPGPLP